MMSPPRLPIVARIPLMVAAMMIVVGILASQQVLLALNRSQDDRMRELARTHIDALSVALGPHVLRQDIWEVYDTLTRASGQGAGRRISFMAVADATGRVLAATNPARAPIDSPIAEMAAGAATPGQLKISPDRPLLRLTAPLVYQGRTVGEMLTELDVSDLLAERVRVGRLLVGGNALATLLLAGVAFLVTRRMLRPLRLLTDHISQGGDAPRPFEPEEIPPGDSEIRRLFLSFNRMVAAVEEKKLAERRLAERERFVSLGRLASSLAHEINNPLGGLKNAADTIRTYAERPEVVRKSAEILTRGLDHLAKVTQATLDTHRVDRHDAPLVPQDIEDLGALVAPELRRRQQRIEWEIDTGSEELAHLPAAPVRQIVLNLLLNASAAAGDGGRLALRAEARPDGVAFSVSDTGPGLSEQALLRLLSDEPVAPGGGLGLRLVHDVVSELGGEIFVNREQGMTRIEVRLPARTRQAETEDA